MENVRTFQNSSRVSVALVCTSKGWVRLIHGEQASSDAMSSSTPETARKGLSSALGLCDFDRTVVPYHFSGSCVSLLLH
ncbi:hypothetical protein F2P79_005591 [Pimephales promelas]|nr:hypothetical protein F2P79_005591 [Pimephales promelas]